MTQTERIEHMERLLNRASQAVNNMAVTWEEYIEAQTAITELEAYYRSKQWRQDFADDEAGLLPQNLKRGVLSEDAIWNLLSDHRELLAQMKAHLGSL